MDCAAPLGAAALLPEERKVVTALFCMKGAYRWPARPRPLAPVATGRNRAVSTVRPEIELAPR